MENYLCYALKAFVSPAAVVLLSQDWDLELSDAAEPPPSL